jgi:hypothetical protein
MVSIQTILCKTECQKQHIKNGNVVLGFSSVSALMLDVDLQVEEYVIEFAKEFSKFYGLGSVLIEQTSKSVQKDLEGNTLGNYCVIFGKSLEWQDILMFVEEARHLNFIKHDFAYLLKFGSITIRVKAKNDRIPPPKRILLYCNGDMTEISHFLEFKKNCEGLGMCEKGKRFFEN